eukprot:scaffold2144_cov334-Prasinococcus_capsulatus_cf.AAC.12
MGRRLCQLVGHVALVAGRRTLAEAAAPYGARARGVRAGVDAGICVRVRSEPCRERRAALALPDLTCPLASLMAPWEGQRPRWKAATLIEAATRRNCPRGRLTRTAALPKPRC